MILLRRPSKMLIIAVPWCPFSFPFESHVVNNRLPLHVLLSVTLMSCMVFWPESHRPVSTSSFQTVTLAVACWQLHERLQLVIRHERKLFAVLVMTIRIEYRSWLSSNLSVNPGGSATAESQWTGIINHCDAVLCDLSISL